MEIVLNNTPETIDSESMSIADLLIYKNFTFRLLVVRINDHPVLRKDYPQAKIKHGDNVDVIHMISGG
jgi:thiamine biosynthesis protein ThiS